VQTYEAVTNTQIFGNAQPFAGRRTNENLGGREAEEGYFQFLSEPSSATKGCSRFSKEGNPRSRVSFTSGSRPGLYLPTSVRGRTWLARTLSTQAQAGGEKHNADRGDNPARARIGSSGFVPVGQYVLQKSVGSRSSEKRLVHSSSEACAGVGEGYAKRGEFRDGRSQDLPSLKLRQAKRRRRSEPAR